jgi:hypothetical protein
MKYGGDCPTCDIMLWSFVKAHCAGLRLWFRLFMPGAGTLFLP